MIITIEKPLYINYLKQCETTVPLYHDIIFTAVLFAFWIYIACTFLKQQKESLWWDYKSNEIMRFYGTPLK